MVRTTTLSTAMLACMAATCTAFVQPPIARFAAGTSTTMMSMKGAGNRVSPFRKFAGVFSKVIMSKPGSSKMGGNGGGGMMGGGNGNGNKNNGGSLFGEGDDNMDDLMMLGALGTVSGLWDAYNEALSEKPILVKACTSLVGFSVGDYLAQKYMSKESFSKERLARMAAFGFLFHGTISHFFYNALDEVLPGKTPLTVVKKVAIDQVLWAPIFTLIFFTWLGVTSGSSPAEIGTKIKTDLVKGVVGSWSVWPIAHAINFRFVPTEQRLLYINTIQIFYNVFLSIIGSK